nr:DNAse I-like superfamily protein [Tanacetum cinerariifolium]
MFSASDGSRKYRLNKDTYEITQSGSSTGCDTQPDVPTLTCALGHMSGGPGSLPLTEKMYGPHESKIDMKNMAGSKTKAKKTVTDTAAFTTFYPKFTAVE